MLEKIGLCLKMYQKSIYLTHIYANESNVTKCAFKVYINILTCIALKFTMANIA